MAARSSPYGHSDISCPRAAVTVVFLLNGFVLAVWAARVPEVAARLHLHPATLSAALLALAVGALVAFQLSAALTARAGSAISTRAFAVLFCLGLIGPSLARTLPELVAALTVFGAGNGGLDIAMNAQGLHIERRAGRPVLSSLHAAFSAGGLAGAGFGALAAAIHLSTGTEFATVAAAATVAALAATHALLPDRPGPDRHPARQPLLRLPGRALLALGIIAFCSAIGEGSMGDWSALYLRDDLATTPTLAALGYAAFSLGMLAGRLAGDHLRRHHPPATLITTGGLLAGAGLSTGLLLHHPDTVIAGYLTVGLGLSVVAPLVFAAVNHQHHQPRSDALAAVATLGYAGFLTGPPLIGLLGHQTSLTTSLLLVAALCATAGITARPTRLLHPNTTTQPNTQPPT